MTEASLRTFTWWVVNDIVLAVMMLLPLIAYVFDGSFELAVLVYLAVIAHASIKIHEETEDE